MDLSRRDFVKISSLASLAYTFPFSKALGAVSENTLSAADLYSGFQNPSNAAKPFVRWWWNGVRVVEEELLRELDILKEKGIGGVEINAIAFPADNNAMNYQPHNWLGDDWMHLVKVTVDGAKKRGITCDIIVGSGWPFGGEFLKKEEQIQLLAVNTKKLVGGTTHKINKKELLDSMSFLMTYPKGYIELAGLRLAPTKMDAFTPGVDLNAQLNNEVINIVVPEGEHVLYYLVRLTGFTAVTHGAPGAAGPVLNHYSKPAVERYLNRMSDAINAKLGSMGDYFRSVFVDSLELRGSNWCDDMLQQFKQRRGYSLEPYLPYILFKLNEKSTYNGGQLLGENDVALSPDVQDEINRVRYDFEITKQELFHERFLETFVDWCKKNKVKSRVQAYGREYYPLKASMILDIPECETWLRKDVGDDLPENTFKDGRGYRPVNKFVSSAARLTGKHIISCEEITNTSMVFNATLERIKVTGDQSNLSGVTHSILHGFNYSPKNIPFPGWVRYGTFFNERNTWWPYADTWFKYKARLSEVFQKSDLQSNIVVMFPFADMWSKFGLQYQQYPQLVYPEYADNIWEAIHQNGSGCDYITEEILQQSSFTNGKITYGPRSYKTLLMPEVESIAPETAAALKKFAATGGLIVFIGKEPIKSYGKQDHNAHDKRVYNAIQLIKKAYPKNVVNYPAPKGDIIDWYAGMQVKLGIAPFVKFDKPVQHVSQTHYKTADADIFFISNYHLEKSHQFTATFNIKNKTAWAWDPETGEKYLYPYDGLKNRLVINLDPAQSLLIVFANETSGKTLKLRKTDRSAQLAINGPWHVTLEKVYNKPQTIEMPELVDFKNDNELKSFAGVVYYEKKVNVNKPNDYGYLDLGQVCGISEVEVNGKPLGYKWYGKHIYDLNNYLMPGDNHFKIKITTVLGNYAKSLKDNAVAQQWIKKQPLYSAGLLGPVNLF